MGLISVYFPKELEEKIRNLALNDRRSISSEVVFLIERGIKKGV